MLNAKCKNAFAFGICIFAFAFCILNFEFMETLMLLAWLTGCWQMTRGDQVIDEQWMAPRGEVMLSMSRTVRGGRVTASEFVALRVADGKIVYDANPSTQAPARFPATAATGERAVFENPAHDYPKRIAYERNGPDAILAWIDDGAGAKRVKYQYQRVACK
jgi:hypothetical protein